MTNAFTPQQWFTRLALATAAGEDVDSGDVAAAIEMTDGTAESFQAEVESQRPKAELLKKRKLWRQQIEAAKSAAPTDLVTPQLARTAKFELIRTCPDERLNRRGKELEAEIAATGAIDQPPGSGAEAAF